MKTCPGCRAKLEDCEFYPKKRPRRDGSVLMSLSTKCRDCTIAASSERSKASYADILGKKRSNRALIRSLKDRPCRDCHKRFHPVCMDFDHRDPADKVRGVTAMVGQSEEAIRAEAAKCDVVCANCHRIRTAEAGGWLEYE